MLDISTLIAPDKQGEENLTFDLGNLMVTNPDPVDVSKFKFILFYFHDLYNNLICPFTLGYFSIINFPPIFQQVSRNRFALSIIHQDFTRKLFNVYFALNLFLIH